MLIRLVHERYSTANVENKLLGFRVYLAVPVIVTSDPWAAVG